MFQARVAYSRTWRGWFFNVTGYIFAVWCLYKIIMCTINIVFQRVAKLDPVSRTLELALRYGLGLRIEVAFWAQQLSFWVIGLLVATQLRGVLMQSMRLFHDHSSIYLLSSTSSPAKLLLALLAELLVAYLLSSVLLIRMQLPLVYRRVVTRVLGDINFVFFHNYFDAIFVFSAVCTMLVFFLSRQSRRQAKLYED